MSISSLLTNIYLFFGLIVAIYVLIASYNIYKKGYKATSSFIGIVIAIVLFAISFGSALTAIHDLGFALDKAIPNPTNPNNNTPNSTTKGKFY